MQDLNEKNTVDIEEARKIAIKHFKTIISTISRIAGQLEITEKELTNLIRHAIVKQSNSIPTMIRLTGTSRKVIQKIIDSNNSSELPEALSTRVLKEWKEKHPVEINSKGRNSEFQELVKSVSLLTYGEVKNLLLETKTVEENNDHLVRKADQVSIDAGYLKQLQSIAEACEAENVKAAIIKSSGGDIGTEQLEQILKNIQLT